MPNIVLTFFSSIFRPAFIPVSATQIDTYSVAFVGTFPITIHWPKNLSDYYDSAQIYDWFTFYFGLNFYTANMLEEDSLVIDNRSIDRIVIQTWGPKSPTGVSLREPAFPESPELQQNYPNPFNPSTSILYSVNSTQYVSLKIYDVLGREVATVVNETKAPGTHEVEWCAESQSHGVYFYRLSAGKYFETKKMFLIK